MSIARMEVESFNPSMSFDGGCVDGVVHFCSNESSEAIFSLTRAAH